MPKELVEPTGEVVKEINLPVGVAAAASGAAPAEDAAAALKRGMAALPPADPEPSAAQRASGAPSKEQKKEAEKPKNEQAQESTPPPQPPEEEAALEGFKGSLRKAQRAKQKAQNAKAKEQEGEAVPAQPEGEEPVKQDDKKEGEAAPAAPVKADDEAPVSDAEIQQAMADPGITKRHQKRMIYLATKAKELEQKVAALEAKPATDANAEKLKVLEEQKTAAEKELIKYRRRYALESEPEIKKYDEVATKADEAIIGKLKGYNLSEQTLKLIKDMGGFGGFARSNQLFTIKVREGDGEMVDKTVTAAQLAKKWLDDMNVDDADYIRAKNMERHNALDEKNRRTQELAADAENWFKQQQEQYQESIKQQQKMAEEYRSTYDKKLGEWIGQQELLKDKPVPATATPEEKKEIEAFNNHNAGIRALVKMAVAPTSLDEHVAVVKEAAASLINAREVARLKKENEALTKQIEKFRAGATTTGKPGGGSIPRVAPKREDTSAAAQLKTPVVDSLRQAMEQMREGAGDD